MGSHWPRVFHRNGVGLEWAFPEGWREHSPPASWLGLLLSTPGESGDKIPAACELFWEHDAIVLEDFFFF